MAKNEEQARVCCKLNGKTRCDDFIPIDDATDLLNDCNKFGKYSGTHWIETRAEYEKKQREREISEAWKQHTQSQIGAE